MNDYLITFRSITPAQRARDLLFHQGISAGLQRTPRALAQRGCGYSLRVQDVERAVCLLRERGVSYNNVFRLLPGGKVEEVVA